VSNPTNPLAQVAKGAAMGLMEHGKTVGEYIEERDAAYEDRNLLAVAFVGLAAEEYDINRVGWYDHGGEDWAVIYADLFEGQVSWHVPREVVPEWLPERPTSVYDGHSRAEKNDVLRELIELYGGPTDD